MKKSFAVLALSLIAIAPAFAEDSDLLNCTFVKSISASFGYADVFSFKGQIKDGMPAGSGFHGYRLAGPASASIDRTASTNVPGSHLGDTTATIENRRDFQVLLEIISAKDSRLPFHILVFQRPDAAQPWRAFLIEDLFGHGYSGTCEVVDKRLISND